MRDAPPEQEVEARQPEPSAKAEPGSEPRSDTIEPGSTGAEERGLEPPDGRQLRERIERLDETLARISAMLPLLRGGGDEASDR